MASVSDFLIAVMICCSIAVSVLVIFGPPPSKAQKFAPDYSMRLSIHYKDGSRKLFSCANIGNAIDCVER